MDQLYAILDEDHQVVVIDSILHFADWFSTHDRTVALNELPNGIVVSTVILGINHNLAGEHPQWFETMVFKGNSLRDDDVDRYATWEEAVEGHDKMIEKWSRVSP